MLKYEFDSGKKEVFLSFWKIKNISDFESLVKSRDIFFLLFAHLNPRGFEALFTMVNYQLERGELKLEGGFFKFTPSDKNNNLKKSSKDYYLDENTLELLDSLNIIHWLKNHNTLFDRKNKFEFTSTFSTWLESIPVSNKPLPFVKNNINPQAKNLTYTKSLTINTTPTLNNIKFFEVQDKINQLQKIRPKINIKTKITLEEKKLLENIFTCYSWNPATILSKISHEHAILSLKDKNFIDFHLYFNQCYLEPVIIINPEWIDYDTEFPEPHLFPIEQTSYSLFYLDLKIYEFATGKSMKTYYPWENNNKKTFLDGLANHLIKTQQVSDFTQLDFYSKLSLLLKICSIENGYFLNYKEKNIDILSFMQELSQINFYPKISIQELSFLINQKRIYEQKSILKFEILSAYINKLAFFGIVIKKKEQLSFESHCLNYFKVQSFKEINNSEFNTKIKKPALTLDSDMSIMGYKNDLNPMLIYQLLIFSKIEISDHLLKAEFFPNKSSFAWFLGYESEKITDFFLTNSQVNSRDELISYFSFYFENNNEFKEEKTIKLTTPSKSYFYKLKYLIQKLKLEEQIKIIEEKKMFLFYGVDSYKTLKLELKNHKMEFITSIKEWTYEHYHN